MQNLKINIVVTDARTGEELIVSGDLNILKDLMQGVKISLPRVNDVSESEIVDQFIEAINARIDPLDPKCKTQAQHLYDRYSEWCVENGYRPMSSTRLAREWQRLGFTPSRMAGSRYWHGIRI